MQPTLESLVIKEHVFFLRIAMGMELAAAKLCAIAPTVLLEQLVPQSHALMIVENLRATGSAMNWLVFALAILEKGDPSVPI
jgi:hypothetical protein